MAFSLLCFLLVFNLWYFFLKPKPKQYTHYIRKPLVWRNNSTFSPSHSYNIVYNQKEKSYVVYYHELYTNESGEYFAKDYEDAINWVDNQHIPSKLRLFFKEINPSEKNTNRDTY